MEDTLLLFYLPLTFRSVLSHSGFGLCHSWPARHRTPSFPFSSVDTWPWHPPLFSVPSPSNPLHLTCHHQCPSPLPPPWCMVSGLLSLSFLPCHLLTLGNCHSLPEKAGHLLGYIISCLAAIPDQGMCHCKELPHLPSSIIPSADPIRQRLRGPKTCHGRPAGQFLWAEEGQMGLTNKVTGNPFILTLLIIARSLGCPIGYPTPNGPHF